MTHATTPLWIGNTPLIDKSKTVTGEFVQLFGETYYRISHYDQMPPFFMSLVSSGDHWLFISSSGGLSAGRVNADSALFPYETVDKITAHAELTGPKTILRLTRQGRTYLWEPFSPRYAGVYRCERHLYKNIYGNKLVFEEINHDLQLRLRSAWHTGERFGFVRACWLHNQGREDCQVELLDGLQNILPFGATPLLQNTLSNLLNAYKRNELDPATGLGLFALSATLTDRAEPSESLQATVVWQTGLENARHLLSPEQVDAFRQGGAIRPEEDVCGRAGAYFVQADFVLPAVQERQWRLVADVNQDSAAIAALRQLLGQEPSQIAAAIEADIAAGAEELVRLAAAADALQLTAQATTTSYHYANVLFNIMRGGIFVQNYRIDRADLLDFVQTRNREVLARHRDWFDALPKQLAIQTLYQRAAEAGAPDLIRLCYEYLPLTFSRRHGDPSRPWNSFSINLRQPDGRRRFDFQGNWRDIFQNWEPLALSFPGFGEGMLARFLNATTVDGYNPYRVTRDGVEWETPEPDNPWANIGYWSDHQIIYLQKLLEIAEHVRPGALAALWNRPIFAYANVPYRLRPYTEMLANWQDTIEFDHESDEAITADLATLGTDARLLRGPDGAVIHATMTEKLLTLLLAKLTNLAPEGGIWMNTQRPEWNDANNALVGKGLSVVTVAYLRRFIVFWQELLAQAEIDAFPVHAAVAELLEDVHAILDQRRQSLAAGFSDHERRGMMDALGMAATAYRTAVYRDGLPPAQATLPRHTLADFLALALAYIEQTLRCNRRADGLYHSYNTLHLRPEEAGIGRLYVMLEGQVAILSSGMLAPEEALTLLRSLRQSELYRPDQHSYLLYPHRQLPRFLQKNHVPAEKVRASVLVAALAAQNDRRLLIRDAAGAYHFHGAFRNAGDVARVLDALAQEPAYAGPAAAERAFILDLFEATFDHHTFTGRSGTFFAYEGLGSVYWHMVSKLLLAAQECYQQAVDLGAEAGVIEALAAAYDDIRAGIGFNKTPLNYGAFPTDPYSHTPMGGGASQPGMTGQVKEGILSRWGELGVRLQQGRLCFAPTLLHPDEFLPTEHEFTCFNPQGDATTLSLPPGSLVFTFCQTPIVYQRGGEQQIEVVYRNGRSTRMSSHCLDAATTRHLLQRDGEVVRVQVTGLGAR
ncbi:MAG: hypothetical protein K1X65_02085 [Caldilineales bacterium]|nr:hypothetical protein [Caldilineales bacterium]MCW5857176.1 hypothetical protein [Caldilineales bacterium]